MAAEDDGGLLGALEFAGVELGEGDLDVVRMIVAAFGAGMEALDAADLSGLPLDPGLDPSRPPGPEEGGG